MASGESKASPFATPSATRAVLERHGLFTKYALGQNFLVNDDVVRKILDLAAVQPTDHVLEVGPGIGTLTAALLQRTAHVTAVEMDPALAPVLADTLAPWAGRFTLLQMDALDLQLANLPFAGETAEGSAMGATGDSGAAGLPNKMVSNLPYAVAATVVLDYLQRFPQLESLTVMVQKEVADRMCARPGTKEYGAYTVKLGLYARPTGRFGVAPGNFFPPPHVESAVLRLERAVPSGSAALGDAPAPAAASGATSSALAVPAASATSAPLAAPAAAFSPEDVRRAACTMADAAFANRRKTLANSCKTFFAGRGQEGAAVAARLPEIFQAAGVDPRSRGETLAQQDFIRLGRALLGACGAGPDEARDS